MAHSSEYSNNVAATRRGRGGLLKTMATALALSTVAAGPAGVAAFNPAAQQPLQQGSRRAMHTGALGMSASPRMDEDGDAVVTDRRGALRRGLGVAFSAVAAASVASMGAPRPAEATYSAYTAREKDWQDRQKNGEIKYSTSRDLRAQLREIAPMNSEGSKVFCPNGPSAAVSPLMENKCGDRLAMPSVYGRTSDTVGNSIPGFKGGNYPGVGLGDSSGTLSANPSVGGFPKYK